MATADTGGTDSGDPVPDTKIAFGEFPFPLTEGPQESRYLTWLRNHSNYMVVRGFLDYLRLVGVLVRGIIVNFLIFLPYLLVVAIALGYSHHWMLAHPFFVTVLTLLAALAWILLFPVLRPLIQIFNYKRSLETGSESSVKGRDVYERSFGGLLLVVVGIALLESMPWMLELFHDLMQSEDFGWKGSLATLAGALALLSGSEKLLSVLRGVTKRVAVALIGVLGVLVPLLVVLLATNFVVYGGPPTPAWMFSPLLAPVGVGVLLIAIAIPLGIFRGAFGLRESGVVVGLLFAGLILIVAVIAGGSWATQANFEGTATSLTRIIDPLNQVAEQFVKIPPEKKNEMDPEVINLVDQVVLVQRRYGRTMEDLNAAAGRRSDKTRRAMPDQPVLQEMLLPAASRVHEASDVETNDKKTFFAAWYELEERAKREAEQFKSGQEFITLGNELSSLPRGSLEPLRNEIAKLAQDELLETLTPTTAGDRGGVAQELRARLADELVVVAAHYLVDEVWGQPEDPIFDETWENEEDSFFKSDRDAEAQQIEGMRDYLRMERPRLETQRQELETQRRLLEGMRANFEKTPMESKAGTTPDEEETALAEEGFALDEEEIALAERDIAHAKEEIAMLERDIDARERWSTALERDIQAREEQLAGLSLGTWDCARAAYRFLRRLRANYTYDYEVIPSGQDLAAALLQEWTFEDLGKLVDESLLIGRDSSEYDTEAGKGDFAKWADRLGIAERILKEELVALLTHGVFQEQYGAPTPGPPLVQRARQELLERALPGQKRPAEKGRQLATAEKSRIVRELQILAYDPPPWNDWQLDNRQTLSWHEVAEAARVELASLVLEEFDARFLGMVAVFPDLYKHGFDEVREHFAALDHRFDELDEQEFDRKKAVAELFTATGADVDTLIERVFGDSMSKGGRELFSDRGLSDGSFPGVAKLLLAQSAIGAYDDSFGELKRLARAKLIEQALDAGESAPSGAGRSKNARETLEKVFQYEKTKPRPKQGELDEDQAFGISELASIAVARFARPYSNAPDKLVSTLMFGKYGPLEPATLGSVKAELSRAVMLPKAIFVLLLAGVIWLGCWLTVDVNLTSIHGLYRDRLASAFLVGEDTKGDIDIEEDVDLMEICRYGARSTAPYHLLNVALNLQGSQDIGIRDRNSDSFIFSKRFIGGQRTGYCRSETMEHVFPQMSLATAMAISAGAASPNMGRATSPLLVVFMTLLNIRLGYWMPNPGLLEEQQDKDRWKRRKRDARRAKQAESSRDREEAAKRAAKPLGFTFDEVFAQELGEIEKRWDQVDPDGSQRQRDDDQLPTVDHGLVGIGFSGGGIRSAAVNLGITQALHKRGVFDHADYLSTVSGGGYLGSSISTLMRSRTPLVSEIAGTAQVYAEKLVSEIAGTVRIRTTTSGQVVVVTPSEKEEPEKTYEFAAEAKLAVRDGEEVTAGQVLVRHRASASPASTGTGAGTDAAQSQKGNAGDQVVKVTPTGRGEPRTYRFASSANLNVRDRENVSAGKPLVKSRADQGASDIAGTVSVERMATGEQIVKIQSTHSDEKRKYRFSRFERLVVKTGDSVTPGEALVQRINSIGSRFRWRVRPSAFLREMSSKLDETHRWVNVSDGGHIENLAAIELLRRRCKYIVIGDAEADEHMRFNGLATLIRFARIDLGIEIEIDLGSLCLSEDGCSGAHFAIGRITYPKAGEDGEGEYGYLLYLKSSFTGDEDAVITEYRSRNPTFPHQSTADQFFDEGQFEAYRALGQHIAEQALAAAAGSEATKQPVRKKTKKKKRSTKSLRTTKKVADAGKMSFKDFETWISALWDEEQRRRQSESDA